MDDDIYHNIDTVRRLLQENVPCLAEEIFVPIIEGHHIDMSKETTYNLMPESVKNIKQFEGTIAILFYNPNMNEFHVHMYNILYNDVWFEFYLQLSDDKKFFIPISRAKGHTNYCFENNKKYKKFEVISHGLNVYIRLVPPRKSKFNITIRFTPADVLYAIQKNNIGSSSSTISDSKYQDDTDNLGCIPCLNFSWH